MLRLTRTYTDFNDLPRTEDFYFNLTEAEIAEMDVSVDGGLEAMISRMSGSPNGREILTFFKDLVLRAYGEKSPDGRKFVKNDEIRNGFASTQAYSDLFMELATDAKKAADFVNGIIPKAAKQGQNAAKQPLPLNAPVQPQG